MMKPQWKVFNESLVMSITVFAAIGITGLSQAQTVNNTPAEAIQNNNVEVQPVTVNPSMEPSRIPRNESIQASGAEGISVEGASTGVQGNNPGNANTGGVQVQNVTVQANPEMDNTTASGYSTVDSLKQRRRGVELDNEARMLEKIEEDRLRRERERREKVEGMDSTFTSNSQPPQNSIDVPVVVVESPAVTTVPLVSNEPQSIVSTEKSSDDSSITIMPFAGQKWIYDNDALFNAYNSFTAGVNLEGRLMNWLSVEGSVGYARDDFEFSGYFLPFDPYAQQILMNVNTRDSWEVGANALIGPNNKKFRPYGLVGGGFLYQKYDIDGEYNENIMEATGIQRATNHVYMNFGGGIDYRVSKNFALGGRVDYQYIFGDRKHFMNVHFGDVASRLRYVGNLQLIF